MVKSLLFVSVWTIHWLLQFIAWSYAIRSGFAQILWSVLGWPLLYLARQLANEHFWLLASLNSTIWAIAVTLFVIRCRSL
jgi:hypothetical protein